jgi:glycosyltransferase involved in cell wall biosynthesis
MRLAIWGPLPPAASGIAEYNYQLIKHLGSKFKVTAVIDDEYSTDHIAPYPIRVITASDIISGAEKEPAVNIYHFGNDARNFKWMYDRVITCPGILVLHDISLLDYYRMATMNNYAAWQNEVNFHRYFDLLNISASELKEVDKLKYNFTSRLLQASSITIVHTNWAKNYLESIYPDSNIMMAPLGVDVVSENELNKNIRQLSKQKAKIISILGGLGYHKRIKQAVLGFKKAFEKDSNLRLIIAGRNDDPDLVGEVKQLIDQEKLKECTELHVDLGPVEFNEIIKKSAVVICLRYPTAGEFSAVMARAFGQGRPVITSDLAQLEDVPSEFCIKIPFKDCDEPKAIADEILQLLGPDNLWKKSWHAARSWAEKNISWDHTINDYLAAFNRLGVDMNFDKGDHFEDDNDDVDVIADWHLSLGLSVAARRLTKSLKEAKKVNVKTYPIASRREYQNVVDNTTKLPDENPDGVKLWLVNIDDFHLITPNDLRPAGSNPYVIANWYFELPTLSPRFVEQVARVDEIWVATKFVKETFSKYTSRHIQIIPPTVPEAKSEGLTRKDFDIGEEYTVFAYSFDHRSTNARKNPAGVVSAFAKAFADPEASKCKLVLKVNHLNTEPKAYAWLSLLVRKVNGVLITEELSMGEMADFYRMIDVYVSLHRAEGFGLGIAEAMLYSKPVIVTSYSGNMDFTTPKNSALIKYRLRQIGHEDYRFNPGIEDVYFKGALWAEPDINDAANWMQLLANDPALRLRLGTRARETILNLYNSRRTADEAIKRLSEISKRRR